MRRLAYFLGLVAIVALVPVVVDLSGATATIFSFVGFPALGMALGLYAFGRWRAGAFHFGSSSDKEA